MPRRGMKSSEEKPRQEEPPPRDLESRRKVLEEYVADLRGPGQASAQAQLRLATADRGEAPDVQKNGPGSGEH
jgi:hypothetical protein